MPFIIMRRTDIPNGVLQIDDLKPNDSQRNYTLDPPGQSGYVQNIPTSQTVSTTGAGTVATVRDFTGLAAYLIDNVEDAVSGDAITAAVANAAAALIIARPRAGGSVTLVNINADLITAAAGAGTSLISTGANTSLGLLVDVLQILSGRSYLVPGGTIVTLTGNFHTARGGAFQSSPNVKTIIQTGAFNISNGAGDIFNFKQATFEYQGVFGPALTVLDDTGAVL
jgi:hypothetical protein